MRCIGIPGQQDYSSLWRKDVNYTKNDLVVPIEYIGYAFRAQNPGISGDTEPPWPTAVGGTVNDNGIIWKAEPEVLCGVVLVNGTPVPPSQSSSLLHDRGFDNPQADLDETKVGTGKEIVISYKRADLYSLPPVYSTATGNPPWGSQNGINTDNDADGEVDPAFIPDRNNRGAYAAVFNSDTASQFGQQFPNDAWAEPSHPLRHPVPCNVYTTDCGGIAKFDSAAPNDAGNPGPPYNPYPAGASPSPWPSPPPSEPDWPVIPFPRDWPPFRDVDRNSVPVIKRLLRMASSIVSFDPKIGLDPKASHMTEYTLEENARNIVTTAPGTPLAGSLRDAYNYFFNSVFKLTDDPSISCRDYKIIYVTDGIDSVNADPCGRDPGTGGPLSGNGPAGDLATVVLPGSARHANHLADPNVREKGIPVHVVALVPNPNDLLNPNNPFNQLQCIADIKDPDDPNNIKKINSVQGASDIDSLRLAIQALLKGTVSSASFASPALPVFATGAGDSAQIPAIVPSHTNEDASLSQWAILNGSLKSYLLNADGTIPTPTPVGTPAPSATPAATPTPGGPPPVVTAVVGVPDQTTPDDFNPKTRRPVWNAARVLGYTDPVPSLGDGDVPLAISPAAHDPHGAINVWPGRKMVWASGTGPTVPLTRKEFLPNSGTPPQDCSGTANTTDCFYQLMLAMGFTTPGDATQQKNAVRTVQFLRGGKTTYGSRDEILSDIGGDPDTPGTYGTVADNTKYSYIYQDDQPMPGGAPCTKTAPNGAGCTDGESAPHGYSHKLGDIFHSEPAVLLSPKYFQYLSLNLNPRPGVGQTCGPLADAGASDNCSYGKFSTLHSKRRRVIFAGANDGFLHAFDLGVFGRDTAFPGTFDLGTGREIFAYAPKALMNPKFPSLLGFPPPAPQYFVDGSVAMGDVFIDTAHGGTPNPSKRTWKSILVGGLRQGGQHYYALDVTQPDDVDPSTFEKTAGKDTAPDCLNKSGTNCPSVYPAVLWELTDDCKVQAGVCTDPPAMGETWSRPVVGRIKVGNGTGFVDEYVAIFGGGFDPNFTQGVEVLAGDTTTRGRAIYIVNVETGQKVYKATEGVDDHNAPTLFAPMPAPPAVADADDDGYLDVAYIGDLNGRMWRLDLTQGSCQNCASSTETLTFSHPPFLLYDSMTSSTQPLQPIFYDAGIIFINGGIPPTLGVAFGSGNRADLLHSDGTHVNRFVLVKDSGNKTFHEGDLVNLTPSGGVTTAGNGPALTANGYFLDFAGFGEKTISTVFSTLGNLSLLTFSSDSPNSCNPGGTSFRYRFSFSTGQGGYATVNPTPGQAGTVADYRQTLGTGLANAAQGQAANGDMIDTALMQSGELNQQTTPGTLKTISQSWKEQ
jgi:hypothetical protein